MNSTENLTMNTVESKTQCMNESEENSTEVYEYYVDQVCAYIYFYIFNKILLEQRLGEKRKYMGW